MVRDLVSGDHATLKTEFMSVMRKITAKLHAGAKVELSKDRPNRQIGRRFRRGAGKLEDIRHDQSTR